MALNPKPLKGTSIESRLASAAGFGGFGLGLALGKLGLKQCVHFVLMALRGP